MNKHVVPNETETCMLRLHSKSLKAGSIQLDHQVLSTDDRKRVGTRNRSALRFDEKSVRCCQIRRKEGVLKVYRGESATSRRRQAGPQTRYRKPCPLRIVESSNRSVFMEESDRKASSSFSSSSKLGDQGVCCIILQTFHLLPLLCRVVLEKGDATHDLGIEGMAIEYLQHLRVLVRAIGST